MFRKKCEKPNNTYTIQSLIYSLKEIMTENPELTWDSEVIISDLQSMELKREFKLYVLHDPHDNKKKLGIYSLPTTDTEETEEEKTPKTNKDNSWWNKY